MVFSMAGFSMDANFAEEFATAVSIALPFVLSLD